MLAGPTHVLVVRGLDENADEEMLRYEFSKHAPIKVHHMTTGAAMMLLLHYSLYCFFVVPFFSSLSLECG